MIEVREERPEDRSPSVMGVVFEAALTRERLAAVVAHGYSVPLRREALAVYEQLRPEPHAERLRAVMSASAGRPRATTAGVARSDVGELRTPDDG